MRGKKPTSTRTWILLSCALLASHLVSAQSEEQIWEITQRNNHLRLQELQKEYQREYDHFLYQRQQRTKEGQKDKSMSSPFAYGKDGIPLYYEAQNLWADEITTNSKSLYLSAARKHDLSGDQMRIGVWDGGLVRYTHQEYGNRVYTLGEETEISDHATLVTGTLVAAGIETDAEGIVSNAEALSYDWYRDKLEVLQEIQNGLLVSNHSYGMQTETVPDWYFGAYIKLSRDWDDIMYNAPYYLMVSAAGNAQRLKHNESPNYGNSEQGYDVLLGFTTSKNGLVVGAANISTDQEGKIVQASIANYSSYGPTDDGRIKPDILGDGKSILTTSSLTDQSYNNSFGTSMATPGVSGSILLMQEYHHRLYNSYMKAATAKGLTLHTASDIGATGPDYQSGWGVINMNQALRTMELEGYSTLITEDVIIQNGKISFNVQAREGETLSASISWTDPAAEAVENGSLNSTYKALVNDLDLTITQNGETFYPWKLDPTNVQNVAERGKNDVDPFERVDIPNAAGIYTITISHDGALSSPEQAVSIIVSGIQLSNCNLKTPESLSISSFNTGGITLSWENTFDTLFEIDLIDTNDNSAKSFESRSGQINIEGLVTDHIYSVKVRSSCSELLKSEYSSEILFKFNGTESQILSTLDTNKKLGALEVFPNPTQRSLRLLESKFMDWGYSIHNSAGGKVKTGKIKEEIAVDELPRGFYVLTVFHDEEIYSTKFLKD